MVECSGLLLVDMTEYQEKYVSKLEVERDAVIMWKGQQN
jgi:hypothetical protein